MPASMQLAAPSYAAEPSLLDYEDSISLLTDNLLATHEDIRILLDWLTTPQDCGSQEFDFASNVEAKMANLEWELQATLSASIGTVERDYLESVLREASLDMDSLASVAEYEFNSVALADRMLRLASAYDEAADRVAATALNSRGWLQMRESLQMAASAMD